MSHFPENNISDNLQGMADTELLLPVLPCFPSASILDQRHVSVPRVKGPAVTEDEAGVRRAVMTGRLGWTSPDVLNDWVSCFSFDEKFWPREVPHNPFSYFLRNGIFQSNQNKTIMTIFQRKSEFCG